MAKIVNVSSYAGNLNAAHAAAVPLGASIFVDDVATLTANLVLDADVRSLDFFGNAAITFGAFNLTGNLNTIRAPIGRIFTFNGTGRLKGTFSNEFSVEHFGADPTLNVTAATATRQAWQYLYDYIAQSSRPSQGFDAKGNYYFDNVTVEKAQSFSNPTIRGAYGMNTMLKSAPSSPTPILRIIGGTGAFTYSRMDDLMIDGNANTIGIEIVGQCGVHGRVGFKSSIHTAIMQTGADHNTSPEDNVFDLFSQDMGDARPMVLRRTATSGTASFSQSGIGSRSNIARHTGTKPMAVLKIDDASCANYNGSFGGYYWNDSEQDLYLVENHADGFPASYPMCDVRLEMNSVTKIFMAAPEKIGNTPFANVVYFRHLPYVQGSHDVDVSNAIFADYMSYFSSIRTRKGAAYGREVANIGAATATPLNFPSYLNADWGIANYRLLLADGNLDWVWEGTVETIPGPAGGAGSVLVNGKLLKDTLGWGAPNFRSNDYIGQLQLIGFTGTPTFKGIWARIMQFDA